MDSASRRREAISVSAATARLSAMVIARQSVDPDLRTLAVWVEQRLGEIDAVFLTPGSDLDDAVQRSLDTAERCVDFYISELRRLEDLAAMSHVGYWRS